VGSLIKKEVYVHPIGVRVGWMLPGGEEKRGRKTANRPRFFQGVGDLHRKRGSRAQLSIERCRGDHYLGEREGGGGEGTVFHSFTE